MIGAPGAHVWQGQVYSHNLVNDKRISTNSPGPESEDDSYLGYSMTLGHFSSSQEYDVAIGMPRGANLLGKVVIANSKMNVSQNITGEQMGAYFGYTVITADVNGDGLDDLVIGAPLFYNISNKEPHYERGRIYIATQSMRHELTIKGHIEGHKNKARFGSAIANCGDLNKDGYQDIAVGAPYDGPNNHGAVYIFYGSRSGLKSEYDQVIYAEDIKGETGLAAFGFSLSGGLDLDNNNYPDLLVGDYKSDRVFFFKARPIVNVTTSFRFEPENFNLDDKRCILNSNSTPVSCINVQYCVKYNGYGTDQRLEFSFKTKLDSVTKETPRLFFLNNEGVNEDKYTQMLTKDSNTCKAFKAYLMRNVRDKLTPLQIDVEYNLVEPRAYIDETKLRPVLNKAVPNKLTKVATIQKNCGPDNICVPDLKLSINPNLDQYTIGSAERLVLDVNVKNYGEDAFESMFYLNMPHTINYITINKTRPDQAYPICYGSRPDQTGVNILTCELGNPQVAGEAVKFSILTEPARGVFSAPDFTFVANVNSTNAESERNIEDNQVAIGIPIRVQVDLTLSGNSAPALVVHNSTKNINPNKDVETDIGPEVYHIYQLQNRGPSTINDIALTILWPTMNKDGRYLLYLVDEPLTSEKVKCKPAPGNAINPSNLKYQRGNFINSNYLPPPSPKREKRQTTTTTTVDNSILQNLNLLSCGPTECTRFECNVFNLGNNEIVHIKIRSRLYEDTLNYISMEEFDISSKLVAQVKTLPYNVSSLTYPPYTYSVVTQIHTTGLGVQDLVPSWVIIVSILAGILLFILLALFLRWVSNKCIYDYKLKNCLIFESISNISSRI